MNKLLFSLQRKIKPEFEIWLSPYYTTLSNLHFEIYMNQSPAL